MNTATTLEKRPYVTVFVSHERNSGFLFPCRNMYMKKKETTRIRPRVEYHNHVSFRHGCSFISGFSQMISFFLPFVSAISTMFVRNGIYVFENVIAPIWPNPLAICLFFASCANAFRINFFATLERSVICRVLWIDCLIIYCICKL